ncbi:hypothetical protein IMSAGC003_00624 [Lachnospiraceae bacterium]|nr:hypothetical protein IMSAGC003_00624 [Lachnospiraceae bacterium]
MEPWHSSLMDAMDLLTGKKKEVAGYGKWEREGLKDEAHPLVPYQCTEDLDLKIYQPDQAEGMKPADAAVMEGRLIGGCMDCLVNLLGTRFDKVEAFVENYKEDGLIWFLEACDLNVFGVRRAMWQMEQAGWFRHAKGFLIGRPCFCYGEEMMGLDQYTAILPTAERYGIPVIMDCDLGHLPPMMPLVSGSVRTVI